MVSSYREVAAAVAQMKLFGTSNLLVEVNQGSVKRLPVSSEGDKTPAI